MDDTLVLLGVPRRIAAGESVFLTPGRATHVAAFLALRGDWVSRDDLVALFWPDFEPRRGRHNLSQLLHMVRRSAWGHDVEVEATRVRWPIACDVAQVRRAVADGDWERAFQLDSGGLLEGTPAESADAFCAWLRTERDDLRETRRETLLRHAAGLAAAERWSDASRVLRRLLADDDLHEEAVQGLIRAEARAGRRDAASHAFETFRARLADDLALEPLEATTALVAAVRRGELDPVGSDSHTAGTGTSETGTLSVGTLSVASQRSDSADATAVDPDVKPGPVDNLGPDATPFIGRSLELSELHSLGRHEAHRLVTIVGVGGSGKSRIARQFARERAGHFEDGAVWVPLASAAGEVDMASTIAHALGLRVEPHADALVRALSDARRLLVLDEVEHLEAAPALVVELLEGCPHLCVVVTSRTALDVPGEVLIRIGGLAVPPDDARAQPEAYDAVALIVRAARRVRGRFQPNAAERHALTSLARVLDGNPLALELAAGWMRSLEPTEVLAEVERDIDVLRRDHGDAYAPHASVRAVFESSWTLLADAEREALRRLSVFRGGVTRAAADEVVDVPINALLTLANRSLVQRDRAARFVAPTVIRRFAEEKLADDQALQAEMVRRHEAWALELAREADAALDTPAQPDALERIEVEHANLVQALHTACRAGRRATVRDLAVAIARSWRWRGRVREGLAWFARLAELPGDDAPSRERAHAYLAHGLLMTQVGDYDGAVNAFERVLADARVLDDPALESAAQCDLADIAWRRGDFAHARTLFETAIEAYRAMGADARVAGTLGHLGNVVRDEGDPDAAHALFDEAIAIAERLGHVWLVAHVRNNKAIAFVYGGDLQAARAEFERALADQRSIGNRPGIAGSLANLGNVHLEAGDVARARELYREALDLQLELGNRQAVTHLELNLGIVAQSDGEFTEAADRYGRALRIRRSLGLRVLVAQSVSCFLDLAVARGDAERALVLAGAVRSMCDALGVPLTPPQQAMYEAARQAAREAVPASHANDLERRGAALDERDAVAFALGERVAA